MIKKIALLSVLALLCLNFSAIAQESTNKNTAKTKEVVPNSLPTGEGKGGAPLKVGDKLPKNIMLEVLKPIIGSQASKKLSLNSLGNKAIILDMWGSWCGTCISRFMHIDSLNKAYKKNLQFLLLNTSSRDRDPKKVERFVKHYLADKDGFSVPFIYQSEAFNTVFFARALPHYVWIGKDGKIKALTDWTQVTPSNIEKLITNQTLNLPIKTR